LIVHWHVERFHKRARVLPEALLARHQRVTVMKILHLALLEIARKADVVMRGQEEACILALQPIANGLDFLWRRRLLGNKVVESKDHQGVGVGEYPFVDRQSVARLINAPGTPQRDAP
jgi:hypothetical protein